MIDRVTILGKFACIQQVVKPSYDGIVNGFWNRLLSQGPGRSVTSYLGQRPNFTIRSGLCINTPASAAPTLAISCRSLTRWRSRFAMAGSSSKPCICPHHTPNSWRISSHRFVSKLCDTNGVKRSVESTFHTRMTSRKYTSCPPRRTHAIDHQAIQ